MSLPPDRSDWPPSQPSEPPQPVEVGRVEPQRIAVRIPQTRPIITYTILIVTAVIFILQYLSEIALGGDILLAYGAKVNSLIREGQVWRFITPVLLHVSIPHIIFNMYALFSFGRELERFYGHARYLALYLIGALAGNVLSFWMSDKPSAGASTALFGLVAAQGIFILQNRAIFGRQSSRILANIGFIVVINLVLGLSPGIDNWGHVGGLIGGALFAWLAGPKLTVQGGYPEFSLADQREPNTVWSAAALIAAGLIVLAYIGMVSTDFPH